MLEVQSFFDPETSTLSHIVFNPQSKDAVVIDPVLDFQFHAFSTRTTSVEHLVTFLKEHQLKLHKICETHAHADHLSGSQILKKHFPHAKICIGSEISEVQKHFAPIYDLGPDFPCDGSQFDELYKHGKELDLGSFSIRTWHTPGHTPACYTLEIGTHLFTGDTLFAPDLGTGRCDFPGGDAQALYQSITQHIYTKPEHAQVHFGHDYPDKRELLTFVPLKEEKASNVRLNAQTSEMDFIRFRAQRDKELSLPKLIIPSLLVNMCAGQLPPQRKNGKAYMALPLNAF